MPPVPFWGWKNVVAFSGGRTSAYMLHLLLEKHGDVQRRERFGDGCGSVLYL